MVLLTESSRAATPAGSPTSGSTICRSSPGSRRLPYAARSRGGSAPLSWLALTVEGRPGPVHVDLDPDAPAVGRRTWPVSSPPLLARQPTSTQHAARCGPPGNRSSWRVSVRSPCRQDGALRCTWPYTTSSLGPRSRCSRPTVRGGDQRSRPAHGRRGDRRDHRGRGAGGRRPHRRRGPGARRADPCTMAVSGTGRAPRRLADR